MLYCEKEIFYGNVYLIDDMGSSPAEHYRINEEKWKKFGEEGQKLMQDFGNIVDEIETHNGTFDISASYIPNK